LVSALEVGGLEFVVLNLARHRDRSRFALRVLCLESAGAVTAAIEETGVPVESLGCKGLPKARTLARLTRRLRQLRPDVLHTHNMNPHFFGVIAAALAGVPRVVHTKHGRNYPDQWRAVLRNRFCSLLTDRIVAVSEDAANIVRDIERVPARKVTVIRNGVDLDRFSPGMTGRTQGGTHAIHVARLNISKDQRTLLEACRLVVDQVPEFRLSIVGDGPEGESLLALRDRLDLTKHVQFLGERHDVPNLLAGADFFVLSSVEEGIPLTVLEAMAAGLAVIATRVGGNPEVVVPGETGWIASPRQPRELAAAMLNMLREPVVTQEMGRAGRQRVEEFFNVSKTVAAYESTYDDI
jgi:sugar transferase (PEP-CTERM/EpsH1 system associated)